MAHIRGGQLRQVARLFGLSQRAVTGATEIDLDGVTQTLPVVPEILRRSNSGGVGEATGLFIGIMELNFGAGATEEEATIDPYNVLLTAGPGYPATIQISEDLDIWILEITGRRSGGTGSNFTTAMFGLDDPATHRGFGVDEAGASVGGLPIRTLVDFTQLNTDLAPNNPLQGANGETRFDVTQRIRRGTIFSFFGSATNAVVVRCQILMGLFPAGLGQDVT